MVCNRDIDATMRICPFCEKRPDGKPSSAGAEAFEKMTIKYAPAILRFQDRGGRSPEGSQRDDFRKRYRRAKAMGFESVVDRWDNDEKDDFLFRRNMIAEGWSRADVERVDEVAMSEGRPQPKRGDGTGRTAEDRRRYEGEYQRVSVAGAQPDTERDAAQIPNYVFQRNARRKAETAYWRGEEYSGPGAEGYGDKGKGKGKDSAKRSTSWSSSAAASGSWWAAAGSTWWNAEGGAPGEPEPKQFDYSFFLVIATIFFCGALLGGVIGYLLAYIKFLKKTYNAERDAARPAAAPSSDDDIPVSTTSTAALRRVRGADSALGDRMPEIVVVTKKGSEQSHIFHREGCHVTRPGVANKTSINFRKCDICF